MWVYTLRIKEQSEWHSRHSSIPLIRLNADQDLSTVMMVNELGVPIAVYSVYSIVHCAWAFDYLSASTNFYFDLDKKS